MCVIGALLAGSLSAPSGWAQPSPSSDARTAVNGVPLSAEQIQQLSVRYGVQVLPGSFWYDPVCGAWGFAGGPTLGFLPAGMNVGGPLRPDASAGTTGVFVNGRELPMRDVRNLQQIVGAVLPGRYWLDAAGNVGVEGGPPFLNLIALARQVQRIPGNAFYRSGTTGIGAGRSGGTSYVIGEDWSVIVE